MSTMLPHSTARTPFADVAALSNQWALASQACNQALFTLLDAQTVWWKDAERHAAQLMQPWLSPSAALTSVQPFVGFHVAPLMPPLADGLQGLWDGWGRIWVNALQHDAAER
jgi:hypothetical protein